MFKTLALLSFVVAANAKCDNSCSGHGTCSYNTKCECYDNWGLGLSHDTGDCSQRICPYDFAWVDKPTKIGAHHNYAECSSTGICNRDSGECECFPGFEGKACQRAACPNDCSGHGQCLYIENLPFQVVPNDANKPYTFRQDPATFWYPIWDQTKSRQCVCDPEYGDVDCSKRMCPYGTDVMDTRNDMTAVEKFHVQQIILYAAQYTTLTDQSFAITFTSKLNETFTTRPIVFEPTADLHEFVLDVQQAMLELPNQVIDKLEVHAALSSNAITGFVANQQLTLNFSFTGQYVQGPQNLLAVRDYLCGDGCTPKTTGVHLVPYNQNVTSIRLSDFNSYECGRRGKCDYATGICGCFAGYTGLACNTITALV